MSDARRSRSLSKKTAPLICAAAIWMTMQMQMQRAIGDDPSAPAPEGTPGAALPGDAVRSPGAELAPEPAVKLPEEQLMPENIAPASKPPVDPAKPPGDPLWQTAPEEQSPSASVQLAPPPVAGGAAFDGRTAFASIPFDAFHAGLTNGDLMTSGVGGIPGTVASPYLPAPSVADGGLHFGAFVLHGSGSVGVTSTTEHSSSGADTTTTSGVAGMGVQFRAGREDRHVTLRDDASFAYPSLGGGRSFTQNLSVDASYAFSKLTLGLGVHLSDLSGVNRDVGAQANSDFATVTLHASYPIDPKVTIAEDLTAPIRQISGGLGSAGVNATTGADYLFSPKTTMGMAFTAGLLEVQDSPTQRFAQLSLRATYASTEKLSFNGNFGAEYRTYAGQSDFTPIFGFGATWRPGPRTSLSLTGSRAVQNSATIQSTNYTSTTFQFAVSQGIGHRLTANASISCDFANYKSAGAEAIDLETGQLASNRRDREFAFQFGLAAEVSERIHCSLSVSAARNSSNAESFRTLSASFVTSVTF